MTAATWNLVVYAIAGDAKEHQAVLQAIDDMRAALTTDRCHIAVQVMAKGQTTRYWISSADRHRTETLSEVVDASHQAPLTALLNLVGKRFPAASTALTLWAHGSGLDHVHDYRKKPGGPGGGGLGGAAGSSGVLAGDQAARLRTPHGRALSARGRLDAWLPRHPGYGCRWGPDPNTGRFLTNVTMRKAIAASLGGRVDVLAINACWMATLEVEYELRHAAAAIVASQVYATAWPYGAIVEALARHPDQATDQLAQTVVAAVAAEIAAGKRDDAVSALRCGAAMEALAAAFDTYAVRVTGLIDTAWDAVRKAIMEDVQRLDDPYQADLASVVERLGQQDPQAQRAGLAVARQLEATRIGNTVHHQHPGLQGLSIFCPKDVEVDLADAYAGTEFRTHAWAGFLAKFQPRLAAS